MDGKLTKWPEEHSCTSANLMSKQVRFVWKESLILWSIRKRRRAKSDFGTKQVNAGISGIGRSDTQSQTHNQRKNRSYMTLADRCKKLYHLCNGRIWQRTINRRTASCFMTRGSFFVVHTPSSASWTALRM